MRILPEKYELLPFGNAERAKGVSAQDSRKIRALAQRIPEGMRGVFRIMLVPGEGTKQHLYGMMLSPDPALQVMKEWNAALGKHIQPTHHGVYSSYVLAGKGLDLLLDNEERVVLPPCRGSKSGALAQQALQVSYGGHAGEPYLDTFPLSTVAEEAGLNPTERRSAKTIFSHVPGGLRDLFYANVVERLGQPTIASIGIDPQLALHSINEGLLWDVARDPQASCPVGPSRNRGEESVEITHSHSRSTISTPSHSSESIVISLAEKLGPPSVHRSYDD